MAKSTTWVRDPETGRLTRCVSDSRDQMVKVHRGGTDPKTGRQRPIRRSDGRIKLDKGAKKAYKRWKRDNVFRAEDEQ